MNEETDRSDRDNVSITAASSRGDQANRGEAQEHVSQLTISHSSISSMQVFLPPGPSDGAGNLQPTSVIDIRKPKANFAPTAKYEEVRTYVKDKRFQILHCHGLAGSGKSEIVRKLAQSFPYTEGSQLQIKWHIQCKDSGDDLEDRLKSLLQELRSHHLLKQSDEVYQEIVRKVSERKGINLVNALLQCQVPVLIIVEDPDYDNTEQGKGNRSLLHDIYRCMNDEDHVNCAAKFHIYVTTRVRQAVFCDVSGEASFVSCHKQEHISGFNETEALRYLGVGEYEENNKERISAMQVFKRFSGSPLGLQAAKTYCNLNDKLYSQYLDDISQRELDINEQERNIVVNNYGENAEHIFQALTMPFQPSVGANSSNILQWKVLCCLAQLHYDRIPKFLIKRAVQILRKKPFDKLSSDTDTENIISNLKEYNMCTLTDKEEVTLHEVVLHAFRLIHHSVKLTNDNFEPLQKCVEVLTSLLTRDIRQRKNRVKMRQLKRHLEEALAKFNVEEETLFHEYSPLLLTLLSFLSEVTGVLTISESPILTEEKEQFFRKALNMVWDVNHQILDLLPKMTDADLKKLALTVVEKSKSLGLEQTFFQEYASKLNYSFDVNELAFLREKSSRNFNVIQKLADSCEEKQEKVMLVTKLQEAGLFLEDAKHRMSFYAERVASIFHNWGRVVLYAEKHKVEQEYFKYKQMISLSRHICELCRQSPENNVPLLLEKLTSRAMLEIQLKIKDATELMQAKEACEEALVETQTKVGLYEDGLIKELHNASNPIQRILFRTNLVRIYGRLMKSHGKERAFCKRGNEQCQLLLQQAEEFADSISIATRSIIYCAKYHAAKDDYDQAEFYCDKYFKVIENPNCKPRFNERCWAVYNYARIVHCSSSNKKKEAVSMCEEILESSEAMTSDLNKLVRGQLDELQKLASVQQQKRKKKY